MNQIAELNESFVVVRIVNITKLCLDDSLLGRYLRVVFWASLDGETK